MSKKKLLYFLLLALPFSGMAQLHIYPIQGMNNTSQARTHSLPSMSLPFWDDFSSAVNTDTLWDDKSLVWVNSGLGINPPTYNVATFDGLDASGVPYSPNPNQTLDYGFTDSLISRRIKMTDVPVFSRNSVFLSFYYQWGGNGEAPDLNDQLHVEFLTNTSTWENVLTLEASTLQLPNQFYSKTIRVNQDKFYHDDFQFRFRSIGRKSGRYDTWHIDYVYMNKGRTETDLALGFPDRAPNLSLSALFGSYFAIPQSHFITNTNSNTGFPFFGISNLSSIPQPMNYTIDASLTQYINGTPTDQSFTVAAAVPILPTMAGFEKRALTFTSKPDLSGFVNSDSIFLSLRTILVTGDSVNTGFEPLNFYMNDTLQQSYTLKDYYAYDDGKAEYSLGLTQTGNLAAYRFILKTNTQDTINGVYVHFPYSAGTSATTTTFMVWANKNGKPGQLLLEELVPVQRKGNNEFILRPFIQSAIVKDTFFIGWQQPRSGRVQIGLDANNDTGDQLYVNVTGNWVQNTLIKGSAMIRPRLGTGDVVTSVEQPTTRVDVFPNPNSGEFILRGKCTHLQVISSTGQPVAFEIEDYDSEKRIRITDALPGLYILRYSTGNKIVAEKIIVRR